MNNGLEMKADPVACPMRKATLRVTFSSADFVYMSRHSRPFHDDRFGMPPYRYAVAEPGRRYGSFEGEHHFQHREKLGVNFDVITELLLTTSPALIA
jgi:hypothetical protein